MTFVYKTSLFMETFAKEGPVVVQTVEILRMQVDIPLQIQRINPRLSQGRFSFSFPSHLQKAAEEQILISEYCKSGIALLSIMH